MARLNAAERFGEKDFSILHVLQMCIDAVTDCARQDSGGHAAVRAIGPAVPVVPPGQIPMGAAYPQINFGPPSPSESADARRHDDG